MTSVTIDISDQHYQKLQDLAESYGVPPEVLLRASLDDCLNQPKPKFTEAVNYVLSKNVDLYKRLA